MSPPDAHAAAMAAALRYIADVELALDGADRAAVVLATALFRAARLAQPLPGVSTVGANGSFRTASYVLAQLLHTTFENATSGRAEFVSETMPRLRKRADEVASLARSIDAPDADQHRRRAEACVFAVGQVLAAWTVYCDTEQQRRRARDAAVAARTAPTLGDVIDAVRVVRAVAHQEITPSTFTGWLRFNDLVSALSALGPDGAQHLERLVGVPSVR